MRFLFVVRFRRNGKVGRYKTYASRPKEAARKLRSGEVISVRKAVGKH